MNLIDRYVTEVGRHLLLIKGRKDIEKELRSTLEDMLEERAKEKGMPADESMQMELLEEYGAPQKVAETYNPYPYLIGPRIFPFFMTILKIVVAAVTLGLSIATFVEIVNLSPITTMDVLSAIGHGILNIISASIAAFGNLALVFALIERFAPAAEFKMDEDKVWHPAELMKEPEPNKVKIWEPIVAIVFTFIAISIINFNPQLISLYYLDGNTWHTVPILSDAFFRWLPLMNVAWVIEIIRNGMLLRTGEETVSTRLTSIGVKLLNIFILAMLIAGPSVLALTTESLTTAGVTDPDALSALTIFADKGMDIVFGIAIFGTTVDIIKTLYKMFTQK